MRAGSYLLFLFFAMLQLTIEAQVTGTVFRDFNANGIKDTHEPFVPGVTVNAYNASGTLCGTAITAGNNAPNYTLSGCGSVSTRVEFVLPTSGICAASEIDYSSLNGSIYGTSVHFVNGNSTNVNFAINNPEDFNIGTSGVNVYIPCYVNGDPLPSGSASGSRDWFVGFPYTSSGTVAPAQKLTGDVIGSTWGVAYSKQANKIFTSAFLKRHVGLGALGSGGIYMLEPTATTFNVTQFFDMDNNTFNTASNPTTRTRANLGTYGIGNSFNITSNTAVSYIGAIDPITNNPIGLGVVGSNSDRGLNSNPLLPNFDPAAFDQVGKVGLGDIDISDDGRFLYVTNLYQRKVFRLEVDNPVNPTSVIGVIAIDLPNTTCNNGVLRPFGLKFSRSKLYIGAICTAENGGVNNIGGSTDMQAYVFSVDNPTALTVGSSTSVLSYDLNYIKGFVRSGVPGTDRWYPWTNDASVRIKESCCGEYMWPQPILSDIEFNERGDIIMSFVDRWGHQYGQANYIDLNSNTTLGNGQIGGDIIISGIDCTSNTYNLESNGSYTSNGVVFSGGVGNSQGIGGGEFYRGDFFGGAHEETSMGGLAQIKGSDELYFVAMDPLNIRTGGVIRLSNTNGNQITGSGYQLYSENNVSNFGKANGLGDIELSGIEAPIEIGNRVWADTDGDGIQDADEAPIEGVTVQLIKDGNVIATATTDANGNYYFSSATGTNTASSIYGITQLMPDMQYIVRIPNVTGGSKQAALGTNNLTLSNVGGAGQADVRDSDGTLVGNNAEVTVMMTDIPTSGANNHNFDFGFSAVICVTPTATASSTNPTCAGDVAQSNGTITISGFTTGQRYQYTSGATFSGTAIPGSITAIPLGGVIVSNLPNTTQQYTVRIYDATDNACFVDRTVSISAATCGACNCKEYIYLNEPLLGAVLKFEVGSAIPLIEKLGVNGGTIPNEHWYPGTNSTQLGFPHGLASDLNGKLYIGDREQNPNNIRQLSCDGAIEPITANTITNPTNQLFSMFSIGNVIYATQSGGVGRYNSCTGQKIDEVCYNGLPIQFSWGLSYNEVTKMIYGTGRFGNSKVIFAYTLAEMEAAIASGTCIDPLINIDVATNFAYSQMLGIVSDDVGNIYVIVQGANDAGHILKFDPTGNLLGQTPASPNMIGSHGITWSRDQNRLYTANYSDNITVDCISAHDTNLNYLGTAAANPGLPNADNTAKALSIIKECCPVNLPSTFTRNVCGVTGTKFYLNQEAFNDCEGIVCGSTWTPVGTLTNMTFDACDNSVVVTGPGCGTFTLNIGAVISTSCGAQTSTFTICNTVPSATVTTVQGTCTGANPNSNAIINITAAINANQAGISTGATYSGPAYNGAGTVAITGGIASMTGLMHNTQYTVRVFNGANDCYTDYTVTTPTITCCALTAVCTPQPQTNCSPINGSASVVASNAVGTVTYLWSSGETTSTISNKAAATYIVTVTDGGVSGCSRTCEAVIANNASAPTCTITVNTQPSCANLTGGSITVVPSPAGTYTYAWSDNGAATANRTGLTGGTYTVTVTNTTSSCTGVCNVTLNTPMNCCNIAAIVPQNLECIDNSTPALITDNRIRFSANVINTNTSLTGYNVTINGGTTITPNTNVSYGVTTFTLGTGTAGGGATFTVTVTDSATSGCTQTFIVTDPGNCAPAIPECPPVKCGTATIQVNGN